MKSISPIILIVAFAGLVIIIASFINSNNKKNIDKLQKKETETGFSVLELFTSEGCSSCPPADALAAEIENNSKNKKIYILAFHVDYWDRQGWKDSFSDAKYSERQRQYAKWLSLDGVYTPQVVINGKSQFVGSDQSSIVSAIVSGLNTKPNSTLSLNCKIENNKVNIDCQGTFEDKNCELVLALIEKSAKSNVRAGENAGKTLYHVQIVRSLLYEPIGTKNIAMGLPSNFNAKGWELIGFVQKKSDGHIISAARFDFDTSQNLNN
jgi:hypothetical protein